MGQKSLAVQFAATIGKRVRFEYYTKVLEDLKAVCDNLVAGFGQYRQFYNVTGNAYTSFTVGLYHNGKLVYYRNEGEEALEPTRPTLKKNEVYDQPSYYDGGSAKDNPYKGDYGRGGQWGPTLGPWHIKRFRPKSRAEWNIIIMLPVAYAMFNEHIHDTMSALKGDLPYLVGSRVYFVRRTF